MLGSSEYLRPEPFALGVLVIATFLCSCQSMNGDISQLRVVSAPSNQETHDLLQSGRFSELDHRFSDIQKAYRNHLETDEDLRAAFRAFYDTDVALAPSYDQWVSAFPKSYIARLARGIYYRRVGNDIRGPDCICAIPSGRIEAAFVAYDKAQADIEASFALDPRPLLSYANAIDIASEHGDLEAGRRFLDKANQIDPSNFVARAKYMNAIETRWGGNLKMMQDFLQECRDAKLSDIHLKLLESLIADDEGWTHVFVDHDYAAAETSYRREVALGGDENLQNLTFALIKQDKWSEAVEPLTKILATQPNDRDALTNRATAYLRTERPLEGVADLRAAAEGGSAWAQNELGRVYLLGIPGVAARDPQMALDWFSKALAQGYSDAQPNFAMAQVMLGNPRQH